MYIYIYIYMHAFRPICSILFLAETTHFAFFGGTRRGIKDNKKYILFGTFWSPFFSAPLLTIKLGKFWIFWLKCGRQIGLMPYIYICIYMLLVSFGGPPNCPFSTHFKSSFEAPQRKKNAWFGRTEHRESRSRVHLRPPPRVHFGAPKTSLIRPFSGGGKWTHGGPQMNASKS